MLDHELKITSEPALIRVFILSGVRSGPFAVIFLLQAVTRDHEIIAECDEIVAIGGECLFAALLLHLELVAIVL